MNTKALLALALLLTNSLGAGAENLSEAAMRLGPNKVKSWFEQCLKLSDNREDRCKEVLDVIFKKETQYLGIIKTFMGRDDLNRNQFSKEYQTCNAQPAHEKYVICLGWLSDLPNSARA